MTIEEINPEHFTYQRYNSSLLLFLEDAFYNALEFGYCDASRLTVRPKTGQYALMITWEDCSKEWCHVTDFLLGGIRERIARRKT